MSKYTLSESFTATEKAPILRLGDGVTRFRIIAEDFLQCLSQFVTADDGKGYSKLWEHDEQRPELEAGHSYEGRKPKRVVLFKTVQEGAEGKALALIAPITVAEQILEEANHRDGLTVSWMECKRTGKGMNTSYRIRTDEPTAYSPLWKDLADDLDYSEVLS